MCDIVLFEEKVICSWFFKGIVIVKRSMYVIIYSRVGL